MADERTDELSLRERKKRRVRSDIVRAAVTLFEERGYDKTSVEDIAAVAEVSPSTFFRYFRSKEDVLLGPDEVLLETLLASVGERYAAQRNLGGIAAGFADFARRFDGQQDDLSRRQARLLTSIEAVQARSALSQLRWEHSLAEALAREEGRSKPDMQHELLAATAMGAYSVAVRRWRRQRRDPLVKLIEAAFAELPALLGVMV